MLKSNLKKFSTLLFISLLTHLTYSQEQSNNNKIGNCGGLFFESKEKVLEKLGRGIDFIDFKKHDIIAKIGSRSMTLAGIIASVKDSLIIYCEDIDSTCMNLSQRDYVVNYYSKIKKQEISTKIFYKIGSNSSTKLPYNYFDKVLLFNTLHEFDNKSEMLNDIYKILKIGGRIFINEAISEKDNELHFGCNKLLFNNDSLLKLLKNAGFIPTDSIVSPFPTGHINNRLYSFLKSN